MAQDIDVGFGEHRGKVCLGDSEVQDAACILQTGAGGQAAMAGGALTQAAFAADFKELVDGENGIIAAVPERVAAAGSVG